MASNGSWAARTALGVGLAGALWLGLAACGSDDGQGPGPGAGGAGGSSSGTAGGGNVPVSCTPGESEPCYTGPEGTEGVGNCKGGKHACQDDGKSWGKCEGEILPAQEDCKQHGDENCDGVMCSEAAWSRIFGDKQKQSASAVAIDGEHNVIFAGSFSGAVDFGGGALEASNQDLFVVKYDAAGKHVWSRRFGHDVTMSTLATPTAMAADAEGNVVVVGFFNGTIAFCEDDKYCPASSFSGSKDGFVLKLSKNGEHVYSGQVGNGGSDIAASVAIDSGGNAVVVGSRDDQDELFCPKKPAFCVDPGKAPEGGSKDLMVFKLDPSGKTLWAKSFGDTKEQVGGGAAVDPEDNLIIAGAFAGQIDFGAGPLESKGKTDVLVAKLSPMGDPIWAKGFGAELDQSAAGVGVDGAGNLVVAGTTNQPFSFGGGPVPVVGGLDLFVAGLDANGNHRWSHGFGSAENETVKGLAVDVQGGAVICGSFISNLSFGGDELAGLGGFDQNLYLAKLDATGAHAWSKGFGSEGLDVANAVAIGADGAVAAVGDTENALNFGNGTLPNKGGTDAFVVLFFP
ncbi:MAG: hypothetical protein HY744_32425 [Deltaproteobacteria bacterium]|nr:hypothetical protein [Deltaproteobacteria bacterium]